MTAANSRAHVDTAALINRLAEESGFDAVGICGASLPSEIGDRLNAFIDLGRHGDMQWLADRKEQRASPDALWPDARSVIMLAANYGPDCNPLDALERPDTGAISVYAQNRDYHDVLKKRLKAIARALVDATGCDVKVFVDTAPVMEKPLAMRAGIGWQGKHTNLVSRDFGSWLFLGAIYTTLDLAAAEPASDHCGGCSRCLDICPTNAFPGPYQIDAQRCISYLTIEYKGVIPHAFRKPMGNRIYGCDDCLAVCPWNKFARASREASFMPRDDLKSPALADLLSLDDAAFRVKFSKSPVKRIGRNRFVRNALIAAGNSGDRSLVAAVAALLDDADPVVRASAIWALGALAPEQFAAEKSKRAQAETEPAPKAEWDAFASGD